MKHTMHAQSLIVRSLKIVGGVLGLGALLTVPAAATSQDDAATTTWTANFQAVNSTPTPPKEWTIALSVGCRGAATPQTELARGATHDVSCTVTSQFGYLAYTVQWTSNVRRRPDANGHVPPAYVEEHSGSAWFSCEEGETAKVTFTAVGRPPLSPIVTRSTDCVDAASADDDPT